MTRSEAVMAVSADDFKKYAQLFAMIAGSIAGMTANKKDDAVAFLWNSNINNPEQFAKLCELFGIGD